MKEKKEKIIIRKVEWLGLFYMSSLIVISFCWVVHSLIEVNVVLFWLSFHALVISIIIVFSLRSEFVEYYEIEAKMVKQ